jgi:hypothetical protein
MAVYEDDPFWNGPPDFDEPHEWDGDEVDVGVGSIKSPCHLCGRDSHDPIHKSPQNGAAG